jgi:hypothetical protein
VPPLLATCSPVDLSMVLKEWYPGLLVQSLLYSLWPSAPTLQVTLSSVSCWKPHFTDAMIWVFVFPQNSLVASEHHDGAYWKVEPL